LGLLGDISISAWLNPETIGGNIVGKYDDVSNNRCYRLAIYSGSPNSFRFQWSPDGTSTNTTYVEKSTSALVTGSWCHVVAVLDISEAEVNIYVNGSSIGSGMGSKTSIHNGPSNFNLGNARNYPQYAGSYHGLLDDVGIWSRKLTADEVNYLYNDGDGRTHQAGQGFFKGKHGGNTVFLSNLPTEFALHQNYPNPFNPETNIRYDLPTETRVTITIYNILGQKVVTLVDNQYQPAGFKSVVWDGSRFASGIYIYQMITDDFVETKKMILLK